MAYLLEIHQGERRFVVGTFQQEQSAIKFLESIPFVQKDDLEYGVYYTMKVEDIPEYYEVRYNNYAYILSKYSFATDEGEVYFIWQEIHCWDEEIADEKKLIPGWTQVDAYTVLNEEAEDYIQQREELYRATKEYAEGKGYTIEREGRGSQDGEYVVMRTKGQGDQSIFYYLDPSAMEAWKETKQVDQFLAQYQQKLEDL